MRTLKIEHSSLADWRESGKEEEYADNRSIVKRLLEKILLIIPSDSFFAQPWTDQQVLLEIPSNFEGEIAWSVCVGIKI